MTSKATAPARAWSATTPVPPASQPGEAAAADARHRRSRNVAFKTALEDSWFGIIKSTVQNLSRARLLVPLKRVGRLVSGDTLAVVRSGNWWQRHVLAGRSTGPR